MEQTAIIDANDLPIYQSTNISRNEDGTYKIIHLFIDGDGREIKLEYPRVKFTLDSSTGICFYGSNKVLPTFSQIEVLSNEQGELFTLYVDEKENN